MQQGDRIERMSSDQYSGSALLVALVSICTDILGNQRRRVGIISIGHTGQIAIELLKLGLDIRHCGECAKGDDRTKDYILPLAKAALRVNSGELGLSAIVFGNHSSDQSINAGSPLLARYMMQDPITKLRHLCKTALKSPGVVALVSTLDRTSGRTPDNDGCN